MKKKEVQENKVFTICNLNKRKEFSTDEAKELLPLLNTITSKAKLDLSRLNAQVGTFFKNSSN